MHSNNNNAVSLTKDNPPYFSRRPQYSHIRRSAQGHLGELKINHHNKSQPSNQHHPRHFHVDPPPHTNPQKTFIHRDPRYAQAVNHPYNSPRLVNYSSYKPPPLIQDAPSHASTSFSPHPNPISHPSYYHPPHHSPNPYITHSLHQWSGHLPKLQSTTVQREDIREDIVEKDQKDRQKHSFDQEGDESSDDEELDKEKQHEKQHEPHKRDSAPPDTQTVAQPLSRAERLARLRGQSFYRAPLTSQQVTKPSFPHVSQHPQFVHHRLLPQILLSNATNSQRQHSDYSIQGHMSLQHESLMSVIDEKVRSVQSEEVLQSAWNQLIENNRDASPIPIHQLSHLIFGSIDPASIAAAQTILEKNTHYFKKGPTPNSFECLTVDQVAIETEKRLEQSEKEFHVKQCVARIANHLKHVRKGEAHHFETVMINKRQELVRYNRDFAIEVPLSPSDKELLHDLKKYALGVREHDESTSLEETRIFHSYLQPLQLAKENDKTQWRQAAFALCRDLDLFDSDNVPLLRVQLNEKDKLIKPFSPECLEKAKEVKNGLFPPDPDQKQRRDLSNLISFAIDDEDSLEIDDAISVQFDGTDRAKFFVHIADATRFLNSEYENPICSDAGERAASIYLPDQKIPMLPTDVSVDIMSLSNQRGNYVLTFSATISKDGEISDWEVFPALISPVVRMTYDQLDSMLESSSNEYSAHLKELLRAANSRLRHRLSKGALHGIKKTVVDSHVSLDDKKNITLKPKVHDRYSRRIVEEFMIFANEISAKFASHNSIVIPYRGTHDDSNKAVCHNEDIEAILNIKPPMNEDEIISRIIHSREKAIHNGGESVQGGAVSMFSSPRAHQALGVGSYTFATSPLRRYVDLLVHHQIKSWLRGSKSMTWEQIQGQLMKSEPKQRQIHNLQRESSKYWTLKYFENGQDQVYDAVVFGQDERNDHVFDVYLPREGYSTKIKSTRKVNIGEQVRVKCKYADSLTNSISFEEAAAE